MSAHTDALTVAARDLLAEATERGDQDWRTVQWAVYLLLGWAADKATP